MWCRGLILIVLACGFTGCKMLENSTLLKGYYFPVKHYRFGTARDRTLVASYGQTITNVKFLLKDRDYTITQSDERGEQTQIKASKGGNEYIIDVDAAGTGAKVHIEVNQAGSDAELEFFMTELERLL